MKKILTALLLTTATVSHAQVSEFFNGMDSNSLKAGISKYILTRGGNINHGESYSSNTFQAVEQIKTKRGTYTYNYLFNLTPNEEGTKLDLVVYEAVYGSQPRQTSLENEQKIMEAIKVAVKGRLLYGLGFDFASYDYEGRKIKAPKGKETGIVLTAVKYDALKQGLMAGDVIVEINSVPLKDIPLVEYASVLNAKTVTDTLTLTCKRKNEIIKVTIKPRLTNNRVF